MKFSNAIGPLYDIFFVLRTALIPTLAGLHRNPALLLNWSGISKLFMANLWVDFGREVDEHSREAKQRLLMAPGNEPDGVVLDIGAGEQIRSAGKPNIKNAPSTI